MKNNDSINASENYKAKQEKIFPRKLFLGLPRKHNFNFKGRI